MPDARLGERANDAENNYKKINWVKLGSDKLGLVWVRLVRLRLGKLG